MKTFHLVAAVAVVLPFAGAAYAASAPVDASAGHYEWRQTPSYGPRAPLAAPRRIWVSDIAQVANRACDMVRMKAAGCMKDMPGMASLAVSVG